jgi:hypothetical protein
MDARGLHAGNRLALADVRARYAPGHAEAFHAMVRRELDSGALRRHLR